jgi:hypothetical protein
MIERADGFIASVLQAKTSVRSHYQQDTTMPLQPAQQQQFWNWLTNAIADPVCPFCGTALAPGNIGEIVSAPAVSHLGHDTHMLQLICDRCAFVSLFSLFFRGGVIDFGKAGG